MHKLNCSLNSNIRKVEWHNKKNAQTNICMVYVSALICKPENQIACMQQKEKRHILFRKPFELHPCSAGSMAVVLVPSCLVLNRRASQDWPCQASPPHLLGASQFAKWLFQHLRQTGELSRTTAQCQYSYHVERADISRVMLHHVTAL